MKLKQIFRLDWYKLLFQTSVTLLLVALSVGLYGAGWNLNISQPTSIAFLAQGDAITDPTAILRYALPIDNEPVRQLQENLEDIANHLRSKRWSPVEKDVKNASFLVSFRSEKLLASVPEERQPQAEAMIEDMKGDIGQLQEAVDGKDKEQILLKRRELLNHVTALEELMLQGFPFEVPEEYANLPQLLGRATVELETTQGNITIVVDGYSAPVNGGNFVDLVQRGFYDGLNFFSLEDDFAIQTGDPSGPEDGFIDPKTGEYRAIPLEFVIRGQSEPIYGMTLEDAGIYLPELALPFNAYGAVALARPSLEPNGGSSQFFFFKFDRELTPPGFNLMDGRYSVFGYMVEGKEVLEKLTDKDKIISAKVIDGLDNLVQPQAS